MSDYLDPNNEELLKDFFAEAQCQVESLEQNVLALEQEHGNRDAVDEIFRAAHTLKGGAGTVEMTELAEFTHLVEDVLDGVRSGKTVINEAVIDALLASIDVIKGMLDARSRGSVYREETSGIKATLASLLPAVQARPAAKSAAAPPKPEAPAPRPDGAPQAELGSAGLSEYELLELREAAGDRRIFRLKLSFNIDNVMKTVSAIHAFAALRDAGTVLKTVPDFEKLYEDSFYPVVEYFVACDMDAEELRRKASIPDVVDRGRDRGDLARRPAARTDRPSGHQGSCPRCPEGGGPCRLQARRGRRAGGGTGAGCTALSRGSRGPRGRPSRRGAGAPPRAPSCASIRGASTTCSTSSPRRSSTRPPSTRSPPGSASSCPASRLARPASARASRTSSTTCPTTSRRSSRASRPRRSRRR